MKFTTPQGDVEVDVSQAEDGAIVVQIDTPVDSDMHGPMRVHLNDAQAVWTSDGQHLVDQGSGARPNEDEEDDPDGVFPYGKLARLGVKLVTVEYHGASDEGAVESVTAQIANQVVIDLPDDLEGVIEEVAYDLLGAKFGGWEINEGSSGEITIDVAERKASIHHGWVVESTEWVDEEVR